jgi:hypothetical protein
MDYPSGIRYAGQWKSQKEDGLAVIYNPHDPMSFGHRSPLLKLKGAASNDARKKDWCRRVWVRSGETSKILMSLLFEILTSLTLTATAL